MTSVRSGIPLDIVVGDYGATAGLKAGNYPIEGVVPNFIDIDPIIGAYRRMVRAVEFDVCQMTPTTYMIARAQGAPYKALPISLSRRFHHGGLVCRVDAEIRTPRDLEGKKVGVRAYSMTTEVWTRGILAEEFGLDDSKVTWVVEGEEHVPTLKLPDNAIRVPPGKSLAGMMAAGEIQAGFTSKKGLGHEGPPAPGSTAPQVYHDLLPNADALGAEWYHRTGIYPMHALIVVKEGVLRNHPGIDQALYRAFLQAHDDWLGKLHLGNSPTKEDQGYCHLCSIVGDDPMPYGMAKNLASIHALHRYAWEQGLLARKLTLDDMFVDPQIS